MIRPATGGDAHQLEDIERLAGTRFHDVGMPQIAEDGPIPVAALLRYIEAGRAWVDDAGGRPCAYVLVRDVDDAVHVEQVSVAPAHAGQGRGRLLLDHVQRWAAARERPSLTLTTFAEVPWNAPYYARLGFRTVERGELGPQLEAIVAEEHQTGLGRWPRVCMRRDAPGA